MSYYPYEQVRYQEEAAMEEQTVLYPHNACEAGDRCPACGDITDFCYGHGEIGDPAGYAILAKHDADDHTDCYGDL